MPSVCRSRPLESEFHGLGESGKFWGIYIRKERGRFAGFTGLLLSLWSAVD